MFTTLSNLIKPVTGVFVSRNLGRRDASIDAFRGLAIFAMIFVNHVPPGTDMLAMFVHGPWNSWTFADTIFPAFLFLVGLSITYPGGSKSRLGAAGYYRKMLRRTGLLILIGIVLVNFPYYELQTLKLHGTLFRIGVCYLVASLVNVFFGWRAQIVIVVAALSVCTYLLTGFEVPGVGPGVITPAGNAATYLDRLLFGGFADRLSVGDAVSQGLIPTTGAIATTLIGVVTGRLLSTGENYTQRSVCLFGSGVILVVAGLAWGTWLPINKLLWTPSYVILMSGVSLQTFALLRWLSTKQGVDQYLMPLQIAGMNALFFYVFAQSMQRVLVYGRIHFADGTSVRLRNLIYEHGFTSWASGELAALMYTMTFLLLCYFVVYILYRRSIFIKL